MISVDLTLFIQLVNFIIGLSIANYFIIKPIREILARRRLALNALKSGVSSFNAKATQQLAEYNARLEETKKTIASEREKIRTKTQIKVRDIQETASREVLSLRKQASETCAAQGKEAYTALQENIQQYARLTVDRLLS